MHLRIRISFDGEPGITDMKKQRLVFFLQTNSRTNNVYTDEHMAKKLNTEEMVYKKFLNKFNAKPMSYQTGFEELYFQTKDEAYKTADFLAEKYGIRLAAHTEKYRNLEQYFVFKDRNLGEIFY